MAQQFLGGAGDVRRETTTRIQREVGQMQFGDERHPPGRSARFALPQASVVVELEQPVADQGPQVVAAEVDEQHVVERLPGVEASVGEVRLRRLVAAHAEVQHREVPVQIEQVVQRLGEDVGRVQVASPHEGVAEHAHRGRGDEVRVREVAVLAHGQIVGVEGVATPGVWMNPPVPRVRRLSEDAQVVGLQPPFRHVPVLRQEETQARFAQQGGEEH